MLKSVQIIRRLEEQIMHPYLQSPLLELKREMLNPRIKKIKKKKSPKKKMLNLKLNLMKEETLYQKIEILKTRNFLSLIFFSIIIRFKATIKEGEEYKVNWKEVNKEVSKKFPKLKIVYSRGGKETGELAISSYKVNQKYVDELSKTTMKVDGRDYEFSKLEGDDLKEFW